MCDICGRAVCPPGCPGADTDAPRTCALCGEGIPEEEAYYQLELEGDPLPLCQICVERRPLFEVLARARENALYAITEALPISEGGFYDDGTE